MLTVTLQYNKTRVHQNQQRNWEKHTENKPWDNFIAWPWATSGCSCSNQTL